MLAFLLLPVHGLAATYYVSKNGSNTAPYDTAAKAASTLKTVVDYIRAHGSGGDTIQIGAGTYTGNDYAQLDNGKLNNLTINGAGRALTILNPGSAHVISISAGIAATVCNLSVKPDTTHLGVLAANNSCNLGLNNVDFVAPNNYTWHLLLNSGGNVSATGCRFYHQYDAGKRNVVIFQNNATGQFANCLSMAAQQSKAAGTWFFSGSGAVTIYNSAILDGQSYAVTVSGSGPVTIMNSILSGGLVNSAAYTISTGNNTVTLANNLIVGSPWSTSYRGITGRYIDGGGNIPASANPEFVSFRRKGYLLPRIDDSANFNYAYSTVAPVLRQFGYTGSFYLTGHDWSLWGNDDKLRSMVMDGTIEVGSHSNTHSDLQLTGTIATVTRDMDTVTVDRAANTISLSGGGTVAGFRTKTLAQIRTELESLGATFVPTVGWGTSVPGGIKTDTYGEVLNNSAAGNQLMLLIDNTAATGYFKVEIADAKSTLTMLVNALGPVIDGQTGSPYICSGFAFPYNNESGAGRRAVIASGFAYGAGHNQNGNGSTGDLEWVGNFDAYGIPSLGPTYLLGTDEAATRANARTWGFAAAHTGLVISLLMHGDVSAQQLTWIFDEWSKFGSDLKVVSHRAFMDDVRNSGLWTDNGDGTFSRMYANDIGDFHLQAGSPCIGAGTGGSGVTTDFVGALWANPPDIGACAFPVPIITMSTVGDQSSGSKSVTLTTNKPATIYYTIDGSAPTTASLVYTGPITIDHSLILKFYAVDDAGNASAVTSVDCSVYFPTSNSGAPVPAAGGWGLMVAVGGLIMSSSRRKS